MEERITVVQPGGDKCMNKLFCICYSKHRTKSSNIPKMEEGSLAQLFNMSLKSEMSPF